MALWRSFLPILLLVSASLAHLAQASDAVSCPGVHNLYRNRPALLSGSQFPSMKNRSFAKVSPAKDWSPEERAQIEGYLDEIARIPNIQAFLKQVAENGFDTIYRLPHRVVEHRRFFFFPAHLVRKNVAANINSKHRSIQIYDSFFEEASPFSHTGIFGAKSVLLHEMAHAFDLGKYSTSDDFLELTGWRRRSSLAGFADGAGYVYEIASASREQIETIRLERSRLYHAGKKEEAFALEWKFAHKRSFPTLYSMLDPQETFAEVVVNVLLDPNVETYLKPDLVRWIRRVISHPESFEPKTP